MFIPVPRLGRTQSPSSSFVMYCPTPARAHIHHVQKKARVNHPLRKTEMTWVRHERELRNAKDQLCILADFSTRQRRCRMGPWLVVCKA